MVNFRKVIFSRRLSLEIGRSARICSRLNKFTMNILERFRRGASYFICSILPKSFRKERIFRGE